MRLLPMAMALMAMVALAPPAEAQFGPGPRALGAGGAYQGLARGYDASFWNPANLALPDRPSFSLALVHPAAVAAVLGPDLSEFGVLREDSPSASAQAAFLDAIPAAGLELRGDLTVPWVTLSAGRFGFGLASTGMGQLKASRELMELYLDVRDDGELNGRSIGSYRVGKTVYRNAALTEAIGAYGFSLEPGGLPVTLGLGARLVYGHRLERGRLFEPSVQEDHLVLSGVAISVGGGRGVGFDIGGTVQPSTGLTVGFSVQNLFQRMLWDEAAEIRGGDFTAGQLDSAGIEGVLDQFEARPFDPTAAPLEAYEVARRLLIEAYLPRVARVGAGFEWRRTRLGATFSSTIGGGDLHAGWPRFVAIGAEQALSVVTVRTGYTNSLDGASAFTFGAGLQLGSAHLMVSGGRLLGSREPADGNATGTLEGSRFADRLSAGSGYSATLGISVIRP